MGWDTYQNGALLAAAESQFDVFLTVDQNIPYQQNMSGRNLTLVIVKAKNNRLPTLAQSMPDVTRLLATILPGQVYRVQQDTRQDTRSQEAHQEENAPPNNSGETE